VELLQYWLWNDGLINGVPVPAEMSILFAAVLGKMLTHRGTGYKVRKRRAGGGTDGTQGLHVTSTSAWQKCPL
jgi:hypothetical protein